MAPASEPTLAAATSTLTFKQVSAGPFHTCAVTTDNKAYCWGDNFTGQLGNGNRGDQANSNRPVAVTGGRRFFQLSTGQDHSCGLTTDSLAYCWGLSRDGRLGDGTNTDHLIPTAVAGGRRYRQLRSGWDATCAIDLTGAAWCWGRNNAGQLGDGTTTVRPTPVKVVGGLHWKQLSGGQSFTCGVTTANKAYCWGNNGNGQLGDSTKKTRLLPTPVKGGIAFRQIDAGAFHTCGVSTSNLAYCWGFGGNGQIGNNGHSGARVWPAAVGGMRAFDHVSAGGAHSCGVALTGLVYCWGSDSDGQLGDGTALRDEPKPVQLSTQQPFAQVSAGHIHTCGRTPGGKILCWGDNAFGQVGDGTFTDVAVAQELAAPN